jgi:hypothetical protein
VELEAVEQRLPKGVAKALIGALLIAALAWGFLYDHVLEDEPQPMQLQPSTQFIGGDLVHFAGA